jgi:hypothetical protein
MPNWQQFHDNSFINHGVNRFIQAGAQGVPTGDPEDRRRGADRRQALAPESQHLP